MPLFWGRKQTLIVTKHEGAKRICHSSVGSILPKPNEFTISSLVNWHLLSGIRFWSSTMHKMPSLAVLSGRVMYLSVAFCYENVCPNRALTVQGIDICFALRHRTISLSFSRQNFARQNFVMLNLEVYPERGTPYR